MAFLVTRGGNLGQGKSMFYFVKHLLVCQPLETCGLFKHHNNSDAEKSRFDLPHVQKDPGGYDLNTFKHVLNQIVLVTWG
jgi:hypothetical protein